MYQNVVIPDMNPGSRLLNRSSYPYTKLDSRFTVRAAGCPGMTRNGFASSRHPEPLRAAPWRSAVSGPGKKGFTLIELLVVVLIIGILAAVALPQYQRAIDKAEMAKVELLLSAALKAEKLYYLGNRRYTNCLEELDLQWPQAEKTFAWNDVYYYQIDEYTLGLGSASGVSVKVNNMKGIEFLESYQGVRSCNHTDNYTYGEWLCNYWKKQP